MTGVAPRGGGTEVPEARERPKQQGRIKAVLLPWAMRHSLLRRVIGVQVVYRSTGGGLIVGGLSYAALFAIIPTLILVIAGVFLLVDDPRFRQDVIDFLSEAFPAFSGFTDTAVESAHELAAFGGIVALIGFFWGASGLYLNLTRAMERFFPGERVSGVIARVLGVLLVFLIIIGVLAAVILAGVATAVARFLGLDSEWLLALGSALGTFAVSTLIVYGIYRVIPSNPPAAVSARLPAALVGAAIALMTLLYGLLSPWLVSGFQAFGVMASVFMTLIWLRVVFLAMVYGAAQTRYRDLTLAAELLGEAQPDLSATRYVMEQEAARAQQELENAREVERRRVAAEAVAEQDGKRP